MSRPVCIKLHKHMKVCYPYRNTHRTTLFCCRTSPARGVIINRLPYVNIQIIQNTFSEYLNAHRGTTGSNPRNDQLQNFQQYFSVGFSVHRKRPVTISKCRDGFCGCNSALDSLRSLRRSSDPMTPSPFPAPRCLRRLVFTARRYA